MNRLGNLLDKTAIGISIACGIHCLLLPVALVAAPSTALLASVDESLHQALILLILPVSLIGLSLGCRQHRQWPIFMLGILGILVSVGSVLLGHDFLGESGEIAGTLVGASLICASHIQNYRRCRADAC